MIGRDDLNQRVSEWGLREEVVEKDYAIGWFLWGIGSESSVSDSWTFKGGTCLKKCFLETYRFSEDLDFTILPGGTTNTEEIKSILKNIGDRVYRESGVNFNARDPYVRLRPDGNSAEGRVYYRGPRNTPGEASIKLDLTIKEKVVRPTVLRTISHEYPDKLPLPANVRCYSFEEVFAEKLRAMGERSRPRDLYDIVNLFRRKDFLSHGPLINEVYSEKCHSKGIEVFTIESIVSSEHKVELETEWASMLAHQLPALPPFASFWEELPNIFSWLNGTFEVNELQTLNTGDEYEPEWVPPPTVWVWGQGVPLESVRFAGANHLCVELGYQGTTRLIEPYSIRRTKAGNIILCAVKSETGEARSYRIERIQSIRVSNTPFRPRFVVEFTSSGHLIAPPTQRIQVTRYSNKGPQGMRRYYVVECNLCGRQFKRLENDSRLRPHKYPTGDYNCPSHAGHMVDTTYE